MKQPVAKQTDAEVRARLSAEMGTLRWSELQRAFARGDVIKVQHPLDLMDAACAFLQDDKPQVEDWMKRHIVDKASIEDAQHWQNNATLFRAIVVAPWVLVQEIDQ